MKLRRTNARAPCWPRFIAAGLLASTCVPAAAQEPPQAETPIAESAAATPAPRSRSDAFAEFRSLFEARQYELAIAPAKQVVELTDLKSPMGAEELQVALMNLASTQYHVADYVGAEASYLRVIELVESTGRPASPRLARANAGLAMTYHAAGRHELAAGRFAQAVALSRRSEGLFNEEQLRLLASQAESLVALDRVEEAQAARRYALRVVERRHGANSLRYAQELESIGRWYSSVRAYDASRLSLRHALRIVEAAEGEDSRSLVGPLTAIADNARRRFLDPTQRESDSTQEERRTLFHDPAAQMPVSLSPSSLLVEGQQALERAVRIAGTGADPSPAQVADTHTQLGDWLQWRDREGDALPHYQQAWEAAGRAQVDGKPLQDALFGQPVLLYHAWPDSWDRYRQRPAAEAGLRHVEIELTVTAQGRTQDAKVLADADDRKLAEQALRAASTARYRPRMENGHPVPTAGVRLTQPFYVLLEAPTVPED